MLRFFVIIIFLSDLSSISFQNYFTFLYVICLMFFIYVLRSVHVRVSKFCVSSVISFCIFVNHLSVTNGSVGMSWNIDHFSVKILKLRNFTELLSNPLFICYVIKTIALKNIFIAKERIFMFWGFSLFFSYQIFVSLIFCVITTLFQIVTSLKVNYSNYRRCEIPHRWICSKIPIFGSPLLHTCTILRLRF